MLGGAIRKEGLKQRQKRGEPIARERDPQLGIKVNPHTRISKATQINENTTKYKDKLIQKYKYK